MPYASPEDRKAFWDGYYGKNADTIRQRSRDWYAANKPRAQENHRAYEAANRESIRASNAKWRASNPEKNLLARYKSRARKRGLAFDLTEADIVIPEVCPVLGIPILIGGSIEHAPSMDRIDNAKGYVRGNVVIVSWRANRIKNDATIDELRKIAAFYAAKVSS